MNSFQNDNRKNEWTKFVDYDGTANDCSSAALQQWNDNDERRQASMSSSDCKHKLAGYGRLYTEYPSSSKHNDQSDKFIWRCYWVRTKNYVEEFESVIRK